MKLATTAALFADTRLCLLKLLTIKRRLKHIVLERDQWTQCTHLAHLDTVLKQNFAQFT